MDPPNLCRVDGCSRRGVVSVARDGLPDRVLLCATHTEDFRMNGERWVFTWDPTAEAPASVSPAPLPAVGRAPSGYLGNPVAPVPRTGRFKSRLPGWLRRPS